MVKHTQYLTREQLQAGLDHISASPKEIGRLELIVRRPRVNERETLAEALLDLRTGLVGDTWQSRSSPRTKDGAPHPETQLTLMNSRVIALLAQTKERWALAGDQFFVDLDLSVINLPPGTRLKIGSAIIEVSAQPHTGCSKFAARFGQEALLFVNAPGGRELRLRGLNARVIQAGPISIGHCVEKLS